MQGLQSAKDSGDGLGRDSGNVVQRLLSGQVDARGLGMELEAPGLGVLDAECVAHDGRPDAPAGAELGDLLKQADGYVKEKGKAWEKEFGIQAAIDAIPGVLYRCAQRECHGFGRSGAGLLHVLANNRKGIPARDLLKGERDMIDQHAPGAGQRQTEKHMIGHVVRDVITLIGCPGDARPRDTPPLSNSEQKR